MVAGMGCQTLAFVGWHFPFFLFQICNHVTAVSFFRLAYNGCGMRSWWIVARLPVRMDRGIW
jgi:hypothetical protein